MSFSSDTALDVPAGPEEVEACFVWAQNRAGKCIHDLLKTESFSSSARLQDFKQNSSTNVGCVKFANPIVVHFKAAGFS